MELAGERRLSGLMSIYVAGTPVPGTVCPDSLVGRGGGEDGVPRRELSLLMDGMPIDEMSLPYTIGDTQDYS